MWDVGRPPGERAAGSGSEQAATPPRWAPPRWPGCPRPPRRTEALGPESDVGVPTLVQVESPVQRDALNALAHPRLRALRECRASERAEGCARLSAPAGSYQESGMMRSPGSLL